MVGRVTVAVELFPVLANSGILKEIADKRLRFALKLLNGGTGCPIKDYSDHWTGSIFRGNVSSDCVWPR
ncbi:hypothetical protein HRI_005058300 [Hibiscus trionum]|uniref:Uncharacterized protein n=1 Tax=Hibiscus trionum TaxID=183268 RepID=A0A9W7JG37_HIBTR|nr:hypothetical protein HRI_005058300 [Hibiscus trionum]